jgi:hypothetical protein
MKTTTMKTTMTPTMKTMQTMNANSGPARNRRALLRCYTDVRSAASAGGEQA